MRISELCLNKEGLLTKPQRIVGKLMQNHETKTKEPELNKTKQKHIQIRTQDHDPSSFSLAASRNTSVSSVAIAIAISNSVFSIPSVGRIAFWPCGIVQRAILASRLIVLE